MKIALSAGHHPANPGAVYNSLKEHNVAARWCAVIGRLLGDAGAEVHHVATGPLKNKVDEVKFQGGMAGAFDLAVEIHFNACGDCGADGAETLYMPGSEKGRRAAEIIQREMAMAGARDRGVKEGWHKMEVGGTPNYFLAKTPCPAVIVEPAFLDGEFPMDQAEEEALCAAVAAGIVEACRD